MNRKQKIKWKTAQLLAKLHIINQLILFDIYLHTHNLEHTHSDIAEGHTIIRKHLPEKEQP